MASPEEIAIRDLLLSKGVTDPATTAQWAIVRVIPTTLDVRFVAASPRFTTLALSLSAIGDTTVVAAQSGSPIRVRKLFLSAAGALALTIKDGGGAMLGGVLNLALGVPLVGAREAGGHQEEPLSDAYQPDPMVNSPIGASASTPKAGSDISDGWIRITVDHVPDRRASDGA